MNTDESTAASAPSRPPGRPRDFDTDAALERAMDLFWRRGYEGTSLSDLTEAMGISRPSLYAAFGNKEALFQRVVERYAALTAPDLRRALAAPTARQVAETYLTASLSSFADPTRPRGCLMVQGALVCSEEGETARRLLSDRRMATEAALRRRFEQARADGDLPAHIDPAALARYLSAVSQGLAVQSVGGASADDLSAVVRVALDAWPSPER